MATVNANIRWADNTAELKQRLMEGIGVIDAMKNSVDRTAASMGGQGLFMQANKLTAAIDQLGGVTKLTAAEQDRASAVLDKAIEKYKVMGMTAPPAMIELRDAMKGASDEAGGMGGMFEKLFSSFAAHVAEGMLLRDAIREVLSVAKEAIADAAKIEDLSKATGISTDALQQMAYVGVEAGLDLDQMGRAVEQLSAKLATGDKNATSAVESLGLSVKALMAEGPKDAFLDITEAVGRVEDPMQRAGLATELFGGRLGKQLLPLMGELREKMDEIPQSAIISDENIKKAHDFDVGLQHLETQLKATTVAMLGYLTSRSNAGTTPGAKAIADLDQTGQAQAGFDAQFTQVPAMLAKLQSPEGFKGATISLQNLNEETQDGAKNMAVLRAEMKTLDIEIAEHIAANKAAAAAVKTFLAAEENLMPVLTDRAWDGSIDSALKLGGTVHDVAIYFGESEGAVRKHAEAMKVWDNIVSIEATKSVQQLDAELRQMGTAVPQSFFTDMDKSADAVIRLEHGVALTHGELTTLGEAAKPSMESLYEGLTKSEKVVYKIQDAFNAMPGIMMQAFQGGGNLLGAVQSLGTKISEGLFGEKGPLKDITAKVSSTVTSMTSGLGSTVSGILGKTIGGMLPVIGGLVGPVMDWIMNIGGPSKDELAARDTFGQFQKQFGTLQQTIDAVGAAYVKAGKTGVEAQQALQRALDATHVSASAEKDALDAINTVLGDQKQDDADLNAAVQKYKFSIEELGPAMQKQQLDQQANQLMNDWRLLVQSGISLTTVNEHMASSVQDYLTQAKLTGQEVPIAMQPIIQKMIDQGLLTDDSGKKITDLKDLGVTFAESMTQGFNKIVDKLTELIDKINSTTGAINAIPSSKTIMIDTVYTSSGAPTDTGNADPNANYASAGGLVTASGIQYFGNGGNVLSFAPRGSDTVPAMLTPGEMVLTRKQQRAVFGGGGGQVVNFSTAALERQIARLEQALTAESRRTPERIAVAVAGALATERGRR